MANVLPCLLLLLAIFPIVFSALSSLPIVESDQQLHNTSVALTGAVDCGNWSGIISVSDTTTFPVSATICIPNDASVSSFNASTILPQQLTFENLLTQSIGSRLPTLLSGKSILVTNNSRLNFTINDTLIARRNLRMNEVVVVHGIRSALDYSVYGDESLDSDTNPNPILVPAPSPSSFLLVSENHMNGSISGGNQTACGSSNPDSFPFIGYCRCSCYCCCFGIWLE